MLRPSPLAVRSQAATVSVQPLARPASPNAAAQVCARDTR